jgi:hypothetical protein
MTIEVPKQPFELGDLIVPDVIPHLEDRAVGPQILFLASMAPKAAANPTARGHTHVDNLKALQVASTWRYVAVEYVDTSKTGR